MAQLVKTVQGLAVASVKTLQGLAIASAKTIMGVDNTGSSGITFIQSATGAFPGFSGGNTSGINTSGANFALLAISNASGFGAPTPQDSKSNTWTGLTVVNGNDSDMYYFYTQGGTFGTSHTFGTPDGSYCSVVALAFSGVASSPFDQQNGAHIVTATTGQPGSITPSVDGELIVFGASENHDGGNPASSSGYTFVEVQAAFGVSTGNHIGYRVQTTAASTNPTMTLTTAADMALKIASFKPA